VTTPVAAPSIVNAALLAVLADPNGLAARAMRITATVVPAPSKADCHRSKGVPTAAWHKKELLQMEVPRPTATLRSAVQRPTPTPIGTDTTRRVLVTTRLIHQC
jgi:hypothetical protein